MFDISDIYRYMPPVETSNISEKFKRIGKAGNIATCETSNVDSNHLSV